MIRTILILPLLLIGIQLLAQNPQAQKLKWTCTKAKDLSSQTEINKGYTFITDTDKIEWTQSPDKVYLFTVTDYEGVWEDISQAGSITYSISSGSREGTLQFLKNELGLKIVMTLPNSTKYSFDVQSVSPTN